MLTVAAGVTAALAALGVVGFLVAGGDDVLPEWPYEPIMDDATLDEVARLLERETGSTQVLKFGAYGTDEITLVAPPTAPGDLAEVYRWDGTTLEKWMAEQPGDGEPFDLRDVDADVLVELDLAGREESGEPVHDSRVSIERPVLDHESWIYLNVRETDDDTVALWADLDGTIESTLES